MKINDKDLELMNRYLRELYGETDGKAHFRITWSEDEIEKRITQFTKDGLQLLRPEVRELPKYRQWIQAKYLIEKLTVVPQFIETDLVESLSYEPLFVFENGKGDFMPPRLDVAKIAIEQVMQNLNSPGTYTKYKDPEAGQDSEEVRKVQLDNMYSQLFDNESDVTDALAYREGVAFGQGSSPNTVIAPIIKES